ncbi:hypothetical protein D9758_011505 [Tetrapyrgos nigripes]|uniref:Uncharacterized protein n=1 Tax=Tetrapyrgos nigripes TaxID=182062 RepID=A0A8H5FRS8_9AGAR|nr:hypothetical protein D9758_011505 [Tetrapyrgos nigripes]
MQRSTCTMLRVRSTAEAQVILHAVSLNLLPIVSRRLDTEERQHITSGCVFVWKESGSNAEATGLGIVRWTDSKRWGPSRVKDEFLFYHEKEREPTEIELAVSDSDETRGLYRENLVKQTYSVFVDTRRGRSKWHLIAYFTQNSLPYLKTIHDIPGLANLHVPPGKYKNTRSARRRPRDSYDPFQVNPWTGVSPQVSYTAYTQTNPNSLTIPLLTGSPPDYHRESPTNDPRSTNNRSRSSPESPRHSLFQDSGSLSPHSTNSTPSEDSCSSQQSSPESLVFPFPVGLQNKCQLFEYDDQTPPPYLLWQPPAETAQSGSERGHGNAHRTLSCHSDGEAGGAGGGFHGQNESGYSPCFQNNESYHHNSRPHQTMLNDSPLTDILHANHTQLSKDILRLKSEEQEREILALNVNDSTQVQKLRSRIEDSEKGVRGYQYEDDDDTDAVSDDSRVWMIRELLKIVLLQLICVLGVFLYIYGSQK